MLLLIRKKEELGMVILTLDPLYLTVYPFRYNAHEPGICPNCTLRFS